jgi:hypothetical protein
VTGEPSIDGPPSSRQRELLGEVLHIALIEIRHLAWTGRAQQAGDLADAVHNVSVFMFSARWRWDVAAQFLEAYYRKHPAEDLHVANLLEALERAKRGEAPECGAREPA